MAVVTEHSTDLQRWVQIAAKRSEGSTGSLRDTDATRLAGSRGFYRVRLLGPRTTLETDLGLFHFVRREAAR